MNIRRLTPEQARATGQAVARLIARFTELLRPLVEACRAVARRLVEALGRMHRTAEQARQTRQTRSRPAWQSPYGPPKPRH